MKNLPASYEYQDIDLYLISATLPYQAADPDPMEAVIETVCREFGVAPALVYGPETSQPVSECRQVCMYFLKRAGTTYKRIGEILGHRDVSTIYHALQRFNDFLSVSKDMHTRLKLIEQTV